MSVDWEKSVSIDGVIGDYFIQARKDRNSDDWYIGGVTDEEAREVQVPLSFLQDHRTYRAVIYRDAADAHWQENPEAYEIESKLVTSNDELTVRMAPGGGFAVRLQSDGETPQPYPV